MMSKMYFSWPASRCLLAPAIIDNFFDSEEVWSTSSPRSDWFAHCMSLWLDMLISYTGVFVGLLML
jgi:hypothetical protein